jgi:tetratricopeptide (TPR) repeat protein
VCGSEENIVTCHDCLQRDYCSIRCQKIDRKLHRHMCNPKKDACEMCGKKQDLNTCAGCFHRMYCSPECQAKAWAEHKTICRAYRYVGRDVTDPDEVVSKLNDYASELGDSNRLESQLRVRTEIVALRKASGMDPELILMANYNVSITLERMSRYQEAEFFAREMVAESDKHTPFGDMHVLAVQTLADILCCQDKFEESRRLAREGLERFLPFVPVGEAMMRLMEAESMALSKLRRHGEALTILEKCLKTRLDHPEKFRNGGKVPSRCFFDLGQTLMNAGRLDEAEVMVKKAMPMLEMEGKVLHQDMVIAMDTLAIVYRKQGRKKEAAAQVSKVRKLAPQVYPKDHQRFNRFMEEH